MKCLNPLSQDVKLFEDGAMANYQTIKSAKLKVFINHQMKIWQVAYKNGKPS